MKLFIQHSKNDETVAAYLDKYIHGTQGNNEYLELIGGKTKLDFLQGWHEDKKQWMEAFQ